VILGAAEAQSSELCAFYLSGGTIEVVPFPVVALPESLEGRVRGIPRLAKEARPFDSAQGRLWGALGLWLRRQTAGSSPGFQPGSE
jgi:hypothetical protein